MYHRVKNEEIRRQADNSYTMESILEFRRCRWLHKVANMSPERGPQKFLAAWCTTSRGKGKPQHTIRHGYASTIEKLGFASDKLVDWLPQAKDIEVWGPRVEWKMGLAPVRIIP